METDKLEKLCMIVHRLSDIYNELQSGYLKDECESYLMDIQEPHWVATCQFRRFDTGYSFEGEYNTNIKAFDGRDIYIGNLNSEGQREGRGMCIHDDNTVYYSENWLGGTRNGQGYIEYPSGKHERIYDKKVSRQQTGGNETSNNFFSRLLNDSGIGRLDYLGGIFLLFLVCGAIGLLLPEGINFLSVLVFVPCWFVLFVQRCRNCGFNFFIGLLFLFFSPLLLLLFIWPGKSVERMSGSSENIVPASSKKVWDRELTSLESDLVEQMRNNIKNRKRQLTNTSNPVVNKDPASGNGKDANRDKEVDGDKDADPIRDKDNTQEINELKYTFENARRNYDNAMDDRQKALMQGQTEKSYAEDEMRRAREDDDESALSRAREYLDKYERCMDEADKAGREAEKYENQMELCRNRLAQLHEFV